MEHQGITRPHPTETGPVANPPAKVHVPERGKTYRQEEIGMLAGTKMGLIDGKDYNGYWNEHGTYHHDGNGNYTFFGNSHHLNNPRPSKRPPAKKVAPKG